MRVSRGITVALAVASWFLFYPFAGKATVPTPDDPGTNWLGFWSFTDTTNWVSNLGYPPVLFTNLSSSPLGNGDALVVDNTNSAWLLYNVVESDSHTNLTVNRGSLIFWFAPSWSSTNEGGTGPGAWGRLIEVGAYTTNASYGWWSLFVDPEGANLYFASQTNGAGATWLSAPIAWRTNKWHHLALTYSSTNSTLYLDGQLATNGLPVTNWPGADVLDNGFLIGSDADTGLAQARGMFDDVATYKVPLDSLTIQFSYIYSSVIYLLNVANFGNFSSAPFTPSFDPEFVAVTGPGYLKWEGTNTDCVTSSALWLTNVSATILSTNATRATFTIAGGSGGVAYDVFATAGFSTVLSNTVWAWVGQGYHCNTYSLTNLPPSAAYLVLGQPYDSDHDGLTDAYERLSSKTDPNDDDSDDDGVIDGWEIVYRSDPKNQDSDGDGVIDQMFQVFVARPKNASQLP